MKRWVMLAAFAVLAVGCRSSQPAPPPAQKITPGSRIIYNGGVAIWAVCDRGNLIYLAEGTPNVAVVPGGCPLGSP